MAKVYQTFYDVARFTLWADSPSEDGKRARFVLSFRDGNPRFVAYTGGNGKDSILNFPCDNIHMSTSMIQLEDIAKSPNEAQITCDSMVAVYENDKPTKEKKVIGKLMIGKTKEGVVYIGVVAEGKPKIIFPFKPSDFHVFRNANKEVMQLKDVSKDMAIGFTRVVLTAISMIMVNYTNEEYDDGPRKPTLITSNGKTNGAKAAPPQFSDLDDIL